MYTSVGPFGSALSQIRNHLSQPKTCLFHFEKKHLFLFYCIEYALINFINQKRCMYIICIYNIHTYNYWYFKDTLFKCVVHSMLNITRTETQLFPYLGEGVPLSNFFPKRISVPFSAQPVWKKIFCEWSGKLIFMIFYIFLLNYFQNF